MAKKFYHTDFSKLLVFLVVTLINYAAKTESFLEPLPGPLDKLIFHDEFNGDSLNLKKWQYHAGGTPIEGVDVQNLEYFVNGTNNVRVANGLLTITAKVEPYKGKDYTSGQIRMDKRLAFQYGTIIIRARTPRGRHLWPCFYALFWDKCRFEESVFLDFQGLELTKIHQYARYGKGWEAQVNKGVDEPVDLDPYDLNLFDASRDFHDYALRWTPEKLEFYVDYNKTRELSLDPEIWDNGKNKPCGPNAEEPPFSEKAEIHINLPVGGLAFAEQPPLTQDEARRWPKNTFEIDFVRVYQPSSYV